MNRSPAASLLLLAPVTILLGLFFLYPLGGFLARAFTSGDGSLTADHLTRLMQSGTYLNVMLESLSISFWVTVITVLLSYPAAYVLANADRSRKSTWALFVLLPFWSSFLVRTIAWLVLLGRQGPINQTLWDLGYDRLELLYSRGAVLLGMANVLVPFAILTMLGVMEKIDRTLVAAAGTMGAKPVQAFFRVYLPLSMPGVTAAALLVFVTALGFFIAPALLGSARETMITQLIIQQVIELTNWPFAAILCWFLFLVALVIFLGFDRLVGLSTLAGEGSARPAGRLVAGIGGSAYRFGAAIGDALARLPSRASVTIAGKTSRPVTLLAALVILFLIAPLLILVPVSFSSRAFLSWPPFEPGFRWYAEVLSSPIWLGAAARSMLIAFLTALVCFLVCFPAALAFLRLTGRSASMVFALLISPLLVPRLVIAVSLFYLYARIGLVGTVAGLVIGHAVIALPFFFIAVMAVMKTYDQRLDAAAASLGASPWRTMRHVTLPLIAGGVVSAGLFAFVISLDELNIALFASGGLQSTLPKLMWDEATLRFSPLLAAVSTLVLILMSGIVLIAARLRPA